MHPTSTISPSKLTAFSSSSNIRISLTKKKLQAGSNMGTLVPQQAAVLLAALLAVILGATAWHKAEAAAPVVVGSIKCLDCSPNDVNAFKDLQVAIKCRSGSDESYETRAVGPLDDTGVFRIPLAAELLRDDGTMDRDCFAQLHSSLDTPCVGQAPPRIAPTTSHLDGGDSSGTTYLAAADDDTVLAPVACACGKKKKHFMFGPPPPPPRPTPTPTPNPPTYGPPSTPTPTPVPEPRPPAPEEPEPFFKKKPKMKFMHKKKPCPPLVGDDDTTRPAAAAGEQGQEEKLSKKLN